MKYGMRRGCNRSSMPHMGTPEHAPESDEQVAARVQAGEKDAFGILVDRYEQKITRYADRFLYDYEDRRDAVQDVFVRAYENIRSFRTSERFSPWLYRVAHNVFVNIIRKKGREKVSFVDLDTLFPAGIPDETDAASDDLSEEVAQHLSKLDAKYREVLVLFYFEHNTYEEIASILQIPKATVGVRLARARAALKGIISDNETV